MDFMIKFFIFINCFAHLIFTVSTKGLQLTDLRVEAVKVNTTFHLLQLNIKWKSNIINGTKVDIYAIPLKEPSCTQVQCSQYGLDMKITEILLPVDPHNFIEHKECAIEPGCTYNVRIGTSDRKYSTNMTYSVPECVDDYCSCHHRNFLPKTNIQANMAGNTMMIHWNVLSFNPTLLPNNVSLKSVIINIKELKNPHLTWGGTYEDIVELQIDLNSNNSRQTDDGNKNDVSYEGISKYDLAEYLKPEARFMLKAFAIDNRYCFGEHGNFTLKIPPKNTGHSDNTNDNSNESSYKWQTVVGVSIFVVFILTSSYVIQLVRIRKKKKEEAQNWQGVYHHVPSLNLNINMHENTLYIDKDIEEARIQAGWSDSEHLEIPYSCLTIGREIGKGAFGRVCLARIDNMSGSYGKKVVAVKQLKKRPTTDELEEFLSEIATMKTVGKHPNIVNLLGCCTIKQPLTMIMEYVGCGDLLQYLRRVRVKHEARFAVPRTVNGSSNNLQHSTSCHSNSTVFGPIGKYLDILHSSSSNSDTSYITQPDVLRPSVTETMYTELSNNNDITSLSIASSIEYVLDHNELHVFAVQIARGMKHLEEKKITHRDLAARNILIDENKTLKISDFGLSRTGIYVNTRNKKVPLRWLSIEAMRDNLYSSKSDVWAFGIVLWEIGTLGGFPYPVVANHELLPFLTSGKRLDRPENCSLQLYELMLNCWKHHPEERPAFEDIVKRLEPQKQGIYIDFNELKPNYVFPPTSEQLKLTLENNNQ